MRRMKRVLRRLGHCDAEGVIQLKGRVACEINTCDEMVVTELIFSGAFNDLSPEQSSALLSCMVHQVSAVQQFMVTRIEAWGRLDGTTLAVGVDPNTVEVDLLIALYADWLSSAQWSSNMLQRRSCQSESIACVRNTTFEQWMWGYAKRGGGLLSGVLDDKPSRLQ